MKTESQNKSIYSFLKAGEKLTPIKALNMFGCFRLSARIYDIKNDHLEENEVIKTEMITKNDKHFCEYSLMKV